jgi:hypothetical protein
LACVTARRRENFEIKGTLAIMYYSSATFGVEAFAAWFPRKFKFPPRSGGRRKSAWQMAGEAREQTQAEDRQIVICWQIQALYFEPGFFLQPLLVGRYASRRTKSHMPVALHAEPKLATTMVATQHHELNLHAFSGRAECSNAGVGAPTATQ